MARLCVQCPAWPDRAPWPSPASAAVTPAIAEHQPIPSSGGFLQTPTHRESLNSQENWYNASERRGITASRGKPKIQAQVLELLKQKGSPWKRKQTNHTSHLSGEHHKLFKVLLWHAVWAAEQLDCCRDPTTFSSATLRIQLWSFKNSIVVTVIRSKNLPKTVTGFVFRAT